MSREEIGSTFLKFLEEITGETLSTLNVSENAVDTYT